MALLIEGWDPARAVAGCPIRQGWQGSAWRFHKRRYRATDPAGSLRRSGRYHRARDRFRPDETWPALYFALEPAVSLGEIQRHLTPALLPQLNDYRLTRLRLELVGPVAFWHDPACLGLTLDALCHDTDWEVPQRLAAAALDRSVEAIVVPSATRLGDNIIVFPTQLRERSTITEVGHVDPRLYVERH